MICGLRHTDPSDHIGPRDREGRHIDHRPVDEARHTVMGVGSNRSLSVMVIILALISALGVVQGRLDGPVLVVDVENAHMQGHAQQSKRKNG